MCLSKKHHNRIYNQYIVIHYSSVYRYAYAIIKNSFDAEDITQTVMLKALQNLHQLKDMDSSKSWLIKIAYYVSMDVLRINKKESLYFSIDADADLIPDYVVDTLEDVIQNFDIQILRLALTRLDDKSRLLIQLKYDRQLSIKQISGIMDMKEGTVTSRLCRALKKLRQIYTELEKQGAFLKPVFKT